MILLDVQSAFLYDEMRRTVYIDLPRQHPRSGDWNSMAELRKPMYGTSDAPQIWGENSKRETGVSVVDHVDDFLCIGSLAELHWLYGGVKMQ